MLPSLAQIRIQVMEILVIHIMNISHQEQKSKIDYLLEVLEMFLQRDDLELEPDRSKYPVDNIAKINLSTQAIAFNATLYPGKTQTQLKKYL